MNVQCRPVLLNVNKRTAHITFAIFVFFTPLISLSSPIHTIDCRVSIAIAETIVEAYAHKPALIAEILIRIFNRTSLM